MRLSVVAIVMSGFVMSCAEAPTQPALVSAGSASLVREVGVGATLVRFDEKDVALPPLPTGTCAFHLDGTGNYNNFIRTNPDGSVFLKVQDESGTITVTPTGGSAWVGPGRVNVNWPNYHGTGPADFFELTMVGTVSSGGHTANAVCKYSIAHGYLVDWFIKLN